MRSNRVRRNRANLPPKTLESKRGHYFAFLARHLRELEAAASDHGLHEAAHFLGVAALAVDDQVNGTNGAEHTN